LLLWASPGSVAVVSRITHLPDTQTSIQPLWNSGGSSRTCPATDGHGKGLAQLLGSTTHMGAIPGGFLCASASPAPRLRPSGSPPRRWAGDAPHSTRPNAAIATTSANDPTHGDSLTRASAANDLAVGLHQRARTLPQSTRGHLAALTIAHCQEDSRNAWIFPGERTRTASLRVKGLSHERPALRSQYAQLPDHH
jgi:hypothetical protein